jgi:hypothetical protein
MYLFVGAGLVLLSMPLVAFDVNWFGEMKEWSGGFVWVASATLIFGDVNFHPILVAYFIAAIFNLPQIVFPFSSNPERGASKLWVWSFTVTAVGIVPTLAWMMVFNSEAVNGSKSNAFREGYFIYQAGYIVSAIGFHLKRAAFKKEEAAHEHLWK